MSISPSLVKKITRELSQLHRSPPDGIRIIINQDDVTDVVGWIKGDDNTPYQGGHFQIKFDFIGVDYPNVPPKCKMITKIFHPNVSDSGEICVDTLKKSWQSSFGIGHILTTVKCLLIAPNPDSALNPEAGSLLQENYQSYYSTSQLWTSIYASFIPEVFSDLDSASSPSKRNRVSNPESSISVLSSSSKVSLSPQKVRPSSSKNRPNLDPRKIKDQDQALDQDQGLDVDVDVEMTDVNPNHNSSSVASGSNSSSSSSWNPLPLGHSTTSNSTDLVKEKKEGKSKSSDALRNGKAKGSQRSGDAGDQPEGDGEGVGEGKGRATSSNNPKIVGVKRSANGANGNKVAPKRGVKRL